MELTPENNVDLRGLRKPYDNKDGDKDFSIKSPLKLFDKWFEVAKNTEGIMEPNAMAVATSNLSCKPSVRYVLLKSYGKDGFSFFTNYNSRKGKEITDNPQVALLFYWEALSRQIRIEGNIMRLSDKESEDYFHKRPKSSQISASISKQSEVIEGKDVLVQKSEEMEREYPGSSVIPRPDYWGGYIVIPNCYEFWCGRNDRLHDRIRFRRPHNNEVPDGKLTHTGEEGWLYEYLSP